MTGTTEYDFATGRGTLRGYSRSIAVCVCVCVLDFSKEGSLAAVAASSDTHHFRFLVNFYLYFPLPNEVAAGRSNV